MAPLTVKLWCLYYHHSLETWVSGIRHVDERGLRDAGGERLQGVGMAQAEQYFAADPQSKDVRKIRAASSGAPEPPEEGTFLDLGCGWGPIALTLGFASPEADIWALDVNERALDLTRRNAELNGVRNVHAVTADEIPSDVTFDLIWSNPPIRVGKDVLHELLMTWLPRLNAGGTAYLVVQKNLGSDSLIPWLATQLGDGYEVSKYASSKGFRVIEVMKA